MACKRKIAIVSLILLGLAVLIGAFGAHGLEGKLSDKALKTFETGSKYHFYHALSMLVFSRFALPSNKVAVFFFVGILLFSGNCYLYAVTGIKQFAMIVPIGGVSFIIGWFVWAYQMMKQKD